MSPQTSSLSPAVRAEAAAWVARLHSSARSRTLDAGFRRWLEADAAHAQAFELATEAWDIGGAIPANVFPRITHRGPAFATRRGVSWRKRMLSGPMLASAAALAAAGMAALFYLNHGTSVVSTGVGEQRMLTLEDGTHISLNTATHLVVRFNADHRRVQLTEGEAMFDVTHDPKRPFIVSVGDREVLALGTAFSVRRDRHRLSVTLMEGKVQVSPREMQDVSSGAGRGDGAAEILVPGQRVTFIDDQPSRVDRPALEKVTAWRRGEVVLDKTTLREAADEMNRYSGVKLAIEGPQVAEIRVSGIFRAGDSVRFAQAVAETYHLQVDHESRRIVLSGAHPK